jgi:hypothetical protein
LDWRWWHDLHHEDVGCWFGPNGPGTLLLTGGRLLRNARNRAQVLPRQVGEACQGMIGARMRPSGRCPLVIAVAISSVDQLPRPVSRSA